MPELNDTPSIIDVPGGKVIAEHVGRVATATDGMSVAHMKAPGGWSEPAQVPDFDEVTLVVAGTVIVEHDGGTSEIGVGASITTRAGERVRYSAGPEGAEYVAICTPAFSPETVHRQEEA